MARRRNPTATPDPLDTLRVEVSASLGDSWLKAECQLGIAVPVLLRLHAALEHAGTLKPSLRPVLDTVPGDAVWIPDDLDGARTARPAPSRRVGFADP
jgi:hypothetical protein